MQNPFIQAVPLSTKGRADDSHEAVNSYHDFYTELFVSDEIYSYIRAAASAAGPGDTGASQSNIRGDSAGNSIGFARSFGRAQKPRSRCVLKLSADSEFAVFVNGGFAFTGQHPQYPSDICVEECDVTDFIVPGNNRLAISVYRQGLTTSTYVTGNGHLIFEVSLPDITQEGRPAVLCASSEDTLCMLSPFYQSGEMPLVTGQLGFTFLYCRTPDVKPVFDPDFTADDALAYGFESSGPLDLPDNISFTGRNMKKLVIGTAEGAKICAQGLFDFGSEYRTAKSKTPADYMQNAALKSQYLHELTPADDPQADGTQSDGAQANRGKYVSPVSNYLEKRNVTPEHAVRDVSPEQLPDNSRKFRSSDSPKLSVRLKTDKLAMTGNLREGRGIYAVADLGRETFGYFSMRIAVRRKTVVNISYSDHLDDLRARSFVGGRNFAATVIVPEGETSFTHVFSKIGARYLQIYAECDDITIYGLGIVPVYYPLEIAHTGVFETNDALHTAIYETSLRTLRLCMNEHYMDCPQREQALYAMDSRNQMLCGYYAFGEYAYAAESLRLMGKSLRPDGLLELCSPAKVPVTIPSFSIHWIIALCEYTKFSGDTAFFAEWLPAANTIMRAMLSKRTQSGCLSRWEGSTEWWNFHEWSGELAGTLGTPSPDGADACLTALFIIATGMLAELLLEIAPANKNAVSQTEMLLELIAGMRIAFNNTFFDANSGIYASYNVGGALSDYSEYTNALAIISGAAALSDPAREGAFNAITASPKLTRAVLPCTLSTSIFKYDALMSLSPDNITLVMNDVEKNWGKMLFSGATSFWETIKGADDFDDAGSLCHGWSAIPVIVYYKYILGIRPVKCGFSDYSIDISAWNGHVSRGRVYLPATGELLTLETDGRTYSGNRIKAETEEAGS